MNWMRNTQRQIVVLMVLQCIYTDCLQGDPNFFSNKQGIQVFECCYFWNGYIYELVLIFNFSQRNSILSFMCIFFCVFWSELLCAQLYVPPICVGMRIACINPHVVFKLLKIVFCVKFIMLMKTWDIATMWAELSEFFETINQPDGSGKEDI